MRRVQVLFLIAVGVLAPVCGCRPVPTVDPAKLERAVQSMEKAAAATSEAIDARDAAVIPEEPEVEKSAAPSAEEDQ